MGFIPDDPGFPPFKITEPVIVGLPPKNTETTGGSKLPASKLTFPERNGVPPSNVLLPDIVELPPW
jgi:hypothetical protein